MTFKEVLVQVLHWLQQDKGLSLRALKHQYTFDDDLDALQAELIEVRHVAGGGLLVYAAYTAGRSPRGHTGLVADDVGGGT
jgi:hypothetical protein